MIRIRVDDFPQTKGEPQHTLDAFRAFDRMLLDLTGRRYLLGVIPGRCSEEDLAFLRDETDCTIGLHGIEHDESKLDLYGNEFPPFMSKLDIRTRLKEAKAVVERDVGRHVNVYMPPRNAIDMRTASILNGLFEWYTGGPGTDRSVVQRFQNCIYSDFPHEYGRTDELLTRGSDEHLMRYCDADQSPVLTLHWTWETNVGLDHMRKFLSRIPRAYIEDFIA